jgi:hypothetical protein
MKILAIIIVALARILEFGTQKFSNRVNIRVFSCIPAFLILFAVSARAQEPDPLPAEAQKVLKLFTGKCDVAIDGNADLKGTARGFLTLGDRFVRDEFELKGGDGTVVLQVTALITYDTTAKLYRMWSFYSNGDVHVTEGTWNEATRTLTTTSRDAVKQRTSTWFSTFSADGAETWGFVTKDKDGNVIEEVGGKSTARK